MVQGARIEVVGKEGWETEGGRRLVVLRNNRFNGVGIFTTALGQGGFFILVIHNIVSDGGGVATCGLVKLSRGLQVWFLNRTRHGGRSGLVDAERELHALDGAWSTVDAGLAGAFFLSSALLDHIGGMVPFESGGFEFNNAPV